MCRNRAWRRTQNEVKKAKAFRKLVAFDSWATDKTVEERREYNLQRAKQFRDHMKDCSCPMCGNPRKWWNEITIQEKKANDIAKSQDFN